ncbi:MAG: hypothetical protein EOO16_08010 [Chitinophagaceae bacterium]|nr:MAG: hypothetical protein EOO16_08010 [Chitinophagaceae bacterium]
MNVKFLKLLLAGLLLGNVAPAQTTLNYQNLNWNTGICNQMNVSGRNVGGLNHYPASGGVRYDNTKGLILETSGGAATTYGVAYLIAYPVKKGFSYSLTATSAIETTAWPQPAPYLLVSSLVNPPNPYYSLPTGCGTVPYANYSSSQGSFLGASYINNTTFVDYPLAQNNVSSQNANYLSVLAYGAGNTGTANVLLRKLVISEKAVYTVSPASVSIPCGIATTQTFTVENPNGIELTPSLYTWDLGSASNGWTYNGAPAPQIITTTANSLQLTSSPTATALSNIAVTVNVNNTNYGPFNASVSLVPPTFNISGPSIVCNSAVYSVPNLPPGATVSWSISPNNTVLQLSQNNPSANQVTITNQKWYTTTVTLTATISGLPCQPAQPVTKQIANDNDVSASQTYNWYQEGCTYYNVNHVAGSGTISTNSSPVFVHQGCMVYVPIGLPFGRTLTFTGSTQPEVWGVGSTIYGPTTLYFKLPIYSGGIPFTWKISGDGACFDKTFLFFSITANGRMATGPSFQVAPNPVDALLQIRMDAGEDTDPKARNGSPAAYTVSVIDTRTNLEVIRPRKAIGARYSCNVGHLPQGVYCARIEYGGKVQLVKFVKR